MQCVEQLRPCSSLPDPNKEIIVGIGLTGSLKPSQLQGDLRFNKNNFSLGLNYYINRRLYLNGEFNFNLIRDVVTNIVDTNIVDASENLLSKFFFDYDINMTYILFQRLHFSFGTGVADFARLAANTSSDILQGKFQFNVALSLKVYMFSQSLHVFSMSAIYENLLAVLICRL